MTDPLALRRLQVASRASSLVLLLGSVAVIASLWLSVRAADRAEARLLRLRTELTEVQHQAAALSDTLQLNQRKLAAVREALSASRFALVAFHQRDYETAVRYYEKALAADADNAYLLNLRAYALFKQGKLDAAVQGEEASVRADPHYAWGYFDLARFQCAKGDRGAAKESISQALAIDPGLGETMRQDGEFRRLCGALVP
jgi:tetratricopeptide (TPR) repeat protein